MYSNYRVFLFTFCDFFHSFIYGKCRKFVTEDAVIDVTFVYDIATLFLVLL